MSCPYSRRKLLLQGLGAAAAFHGLPVPRRLLAEEAAKVSPPPIEVEDRSAKAPAAPVAIARAADFDVKKLAEVLSSLFDKVGGIEKLVRGKTVTVKLNTTGNGRQRLRGRPAERTYQTHPNMVEALCGILHRSGAKRVHLVESLYEQKTPEEVYASQGWNVQRILEASGHTVTFEDTRNLGRFKDYVKLAVPWGGYVFPAYHLNRRYAETDVLVSVAKLKNHVTAGVTGAVKNLFGIAPTALYGNDAPNERTTENRGSILHDGSRAVPGGVTKERYMGWDQFPRGAGSYYRVPRVTADLLGVRPVDLAIVEGIETCVGGEGPWCPNVRPIAPGVVLAGRNAVTVDAIATAVMGYDPLAGVAQKPWYGDNHLALLARAGVGTNDPARIEVAGLSLKEALHEFEPGHEGWVRKRLAG
ncbi:MAG: DUF362 domain-containing protein [Planctomycetes bacterium]|nr:DUF362 domain-containing protein [Planctomycetota bacterium]